MIRSAYSVLNLLKSTNVSITSNLDKATFKILPFCKHLQRYEMSTQQKPLKNLSGRLFNHSLQFQCGKWTVQFNYVGSPLQLINSQTIKLGYSGQGYCFLLRLIETQKMFTKGRPSYIIGLNILELSKLAYWAAQYGKLEFVRNSEFKQQVLVIQKSKEFSKEGIKFSFLNNKIQEEKKKQFSVSTSEFNLIQQTIKSGISCIDYSEQRYESEAINIQDNILNNKMVINSSYNEN